MAVHQMPKSSDDRCVLVFVRAPATGKVKTRLAKVLDPRTVCDLYQCFVIDVLTMLTSGGFQTVICYHPPEAEPQMDAWLGQTYQYLPQEGADLGARMANAFKVVFQRGCRQALLIGTDFPDVPPKIIHRAFDGLQQNGSVIGPTYDGGYYLIGFQRTQFLPAAFRAIPWGTRKVFEDTLRVLGDHHQHPLILPRWRDIDEYEDLLAFSNTQPGTPETAPNTRALLGSLGLKPDQNASIK